MNYTTDNSNYESRQRSAIPGGRGMVVAAIAAAAIAAAGCGGDRVTYTTAMGPDGALYVQNNVGIIGKYDPSNPEHTHKVQEGETLRGITNRSMRLHAGGVQTMGFERATMDLNGKEDAGVARGEDLRILERVISDTLGVELDFQLLSAGRYDVATGQYNE